MRYEVWYATKDGGESVARLDAKSHESAARKVIGFRKDVDTSCGMAVYEGTYGTNEVWLDGDWVYDTWQASLKRNERRAERRHEQRRAAIDAKFDERKRQREEEDKLSTAEWTKRFLAGELVGQNEGR